MYKFVYSSLEFLRDLYRF